MSVIATPPPAPAAGHATESWSSVVEEMLEGLRYGTIQLTVHDGRVVQIDRTERRRLDRGVAEHERR